MTPAKLFMIPCPIVEGQLDSLSAQSVEALHGLKYFIVERARTARRFIKSTNHPIAIAELEIFELDKNDPTAGLYDFLQHLNNGKSIGLISEAGCPGIADPGSLAVAWAHRQNIEVVPLVGPSSILLALISSGFNGQLFCFHGYLPNKKPELNKRLKSLENAVFSSGQTQIFMETPYKNKFLLENLLKVLSMNTKLCIACNIGGPEAYIKTKTIKDWSSSQIPDLHKKPCVFLLGR